MHTHARTNSNKTALLQGYVAEGLDLGPKFDPEDTTQYRYVYQVPTDADWQIMPTLDYYGYEHEDAITGFVAEYDGQPFNRCVAGGLCGWLRLGLLMGVGRGVGL